LPLGRKALIEAARLNAPPNGNTVGRGMKVNKEEMLAMLVALDLFVKKDHALEGREFERRAELVRSRAAAVPGVKAEVFVPPISNHVPHVRISWDGGDEAAATAVVKAMRDGEPSIVIRNEKEALVVGVWMMQPGEDRIVASRLRQVLAKKA
jgi:L-seryl-tRNA(Ser) seleniumtransferase